MLTARRGGVIAAIVLAVIAALPGNLAVRLAAIGTLLGGGAAYMLWLRHRKGWPLAHAPADGSNRRLAEIAESRLGEPVEAICPFVMRAQQQPRERWQGETPFWLALSPSWIWLLHRSVDGRIGGVKARYGRGGLHARYDDRHWHGHHIAELSWPADRWYMTGELHGPRAQRLRFMGLLAADELGIRELVHRPREDTP
jgi:hypothetical protein